MQTSVLPAKLIRPHFTGLLPRSRLFRILDGTKTHSVVWISGLPGSGKSALVSDYWEARQLKGIWYRFDSGDRDPAGFFYHLGLAFQAAAHRGRTPLPLLTPECRGDLPTFARNFFREFFTRLKAPIFLVYDDCDLVVEGNPLCELIQIGLNELLPGFTVVFISRNDPPSSFSSLAVKRSLQIVDPEVLRLTETEAIGVARHAFPSLTPAEARALYLQSEGWAAGLVLLAETYVHSSRALSGHLPGLSPRTFDYFAREIFVAMPSPTQDLLMRTAYLPEVTVEAAQALTRQPEAAAILADLYRRRYFVEQEVPGNYRYHDLFQDFLRAQAELTYSSEQLRSIQVETAAILAQTAQVGEAIALYHEANDWQAAVALIHSTAASMIFQGRNQTVEGWIRGLPEKMVAENPWLLYWLGVCRQPVDLKESQTLFERAFERFPSLERMGRLLAWTGIVDSIVIAHDDFSPLDAWIEWLEREERKSPGYPTRDVEAQVIAAMINALSFRRPDHPTLPRWVDRGLAAAESVDLSLQVRIWFSVGYFCFLRAELGRLGGVVGRMATAAASNAMPPLAVLTWKIAEEQFYLVSGKGGQEIAKEALAIAKQHGVHHHDFWFHGNIAHASLVQGDLQAAKEALSQLKILQGRSTPANAGYFHFLSTLLAVLEGDITAASAHAGEALRVTEKTGAYFQIFLCVVAKAYVLLEQGAEKEARQYLDRAREAGRRAAIPWFVFNSDLLESYWAFRRGHDENGYRLLQAALALGRTFNTLSSFFWWPALLSYLCVRALERGIEVDYVRRLIRATSLIPDSPPTECAAWPWPVKVHTLGRFAVLIDEKPIQFARRGQGKVMELLQALIALGGREVGEERLTDTLWPDADGEQGHQLLTITLHRLRNLLGKNEVISLRTGKLTLDPRYCWVDVWAFERLISGAPNGRGDTVLKALDLYQGPFLGRETPPGWALPLRERLHAKYLAHLTSFGRAREESGAWEEAAACYERGLAIDPLSEECYRRLMICRHRQGERASAILIYQRCSKVLRAALETEPSPETRALYQTIKTAPPADLNG